MHNSIGSICFFVLVLLFSTSCSKKTSTPTTTENPPQRQQQPREGQRGGQRGEAPTYAKLLEKMDANKDGRLSSTEVKGPLKDNFVTADTNKDGFLSEEEFNNAPRPSKGQRHGPRR